MPGAVRTLVVRCPDWPIVAAGVPLDVPAAVFHANRVVATSPGARAQDIVRHHRRREAQARCPSLLVLERDLDRDARVFEPVVGTLDVLTPRVEITEPGRVAFPTRINGRPAVFTWQLGEENVLFWNYEDEELRRPIPNEWVPGTPLRLKK